MNIEQRLLLSLGQRKGTVLLRSEVVGLGSKSALSRALASLIKRGKLVKIGYGVYAKTRVSSLSGNMIPAAGISDMAYETLVKLGVTPGPDFLTREYNAGRSTQVPARITFNTDGKRVARKLQWKGDRVYYEFDKVGMP